MEQISRDGIKFLAMVTMLLNHIANIFMRPGTICSLFLIDIGYFTMPVMCYFLVEGYYYTHSRRDYGLRLIVFALLSELPYCLAFSKEAALDYVGMNMIFTLLLCYSIVVVLATEWQENIKIVVVIILALLSLDSDWALYAPIYTLLFYWAGGKLNKVQKVFMMLIAIFFMDGLMMGVEAYGFMAGVTWAFARIMGMALAAVVICYLYNGKRCKHGRKFFKWFFYLFYPLHLLVLGLIRVSSL